MRHFRYDPAKIAYPADWETKADAARKSVESALPDKRSNEINKPKHRDLWACLKPELAKVMHGKCWYTEALQTGTDTDVDHFRPKNSVKDIYHADTGEKHSGYWWRAFDPANFRFSCIVANRPRRDIVTGHVGERSMSFRSGMSGIELGHLTMTAIMSNRS